MNIQLANTHLIHRRRKKANKEKVDQVVTDHEGAEKKEQKQKESRRLDGWGALKGELGLGIYNHLH